MQVTCKRDRFRYIRLSLRFVNRNFHIDHNTNFCVDTGAPYSLISYEQVVEWNLDLTKLAPTPSPHRVGGIEAKGYFLDNSVMLFRDDRGRLNPVEVKRIIVLGPPFKAPNGQKPIPPLLGDDILRNFTLIVKGDRHGGEILLTDEDYRIAFPTIN